MTRSAFRLRGFLHRLALGAAVGSLSAAVLPGVGAAAPAPHESLRAYCARVRTDDTLRTPPRALAPAIKRLFDVGEPLAPRAAFYRCAGGTVKVCVIGANLPCGKADTRKNLPAAARWCHTHANSAFIPAYVTGHDTLYSWRCIGGRAEAGARIGTLDARGFFAEYWKTVE